jgi:hypothetical protein
MRKSDDSVHKVESADLEFPDWSGMDDSSARVSPETAYVLSEQYSSWFPELAAKWRSQRPEKCLAEFVL